ACMRERRSVGLIGRVRMTKRWWAVRGSNSTTRTPRSCHFNGLRRRELAHVYRSRGPMARGRAQDPSRCATAEFSSPLDVWLVTVKGVFKWAVINKKIASNPFAGLRVTYARPPRDRDSRAFTKKEARTILRASLDTPPRRLAAHYRAARRWVPWICAYA